VVSLKQRVFSEEALVWLKKVFIARFFIKRVFEWVQVYLEALRVYLVILKVFSR